jgi:hypothetical protein
MTEFRRLCACASVLALVRAGFAQAPPPLVPAGSINDAHQGQPAVVVTHDDASVLRYATAIRDRFVQGATLVTEQDFAAADLRGKRLVVYATPAHPWVDKHAARLPFTFDGDALRIEGRRFQGEHLRVIAALRNPDDPTHRVVLYAARQLADLVEINAVHHGPTEWVVADGTRTLGAGAFLAGAPLSPAAMCADLDALLDKIGSVHPAAHQSMPPAVAAAGESARARLGAPLSRLAFAAAAAPVLLALRDAHSALAIPGGGDSLALPLVWLDDEASPGGLLLVAHDQNELRRGDRVVDLAGRSPQQLQALLAGLVPAENRHWLRYRGQHLLADAACLRVVGVAEAAPVRVRVERDGSEHVIDVGLGVPARPAPASPWVRFALEPEHNLGVITLDRCVVDATYRDTLAKFFAAVHAHKITRIAVDLRANSGGSSQVTDEFLRYLDRDSFANFSGDVRWSQDALSQRKAPGPVRFEPAKAVRRPNAKVTEPPPFAGELFVLTGPATFSSGNWFAVVVRDNGFGKIVGEPTGNAPSSYGDVLSFTLPASCLSYTLSFKRWARPKPSEDPADTLLPDVVVSRTRASVRDGSDPVLAWLRQR